MGLEWFRSLLVKKFGRESEAARNAARRLCDRLSRRSWLTTVGVGADSGRSCLVVYVSISPKKIVDQIPPTREGFSVLVRKMQIPRPQ